MRKSLFAGLTILDPDEPLTTDGGAFTGKDREVIANLLRVGAVTHRHDAHAALADPTLAPAAEAITASGGLPADRAFSVGFTIRDDQDGETRLSPAVVISTPDAIPTPEQAPSAVVDYSAGSLRADSYYYAATITDGMGGETPPGPAALAERAAGYASGRVLLSGLDALVTEAGGAGWRLYRATGGGQLDFLAEGVTADFIDDGTVACDCNIRPPVDNRTRAFNSLRITVPAAAASAASAFSVYVSETGDFISPSLFGTFPAASAGTEMMMTSLALQPGSPPDTSTSIPGANLIDPDTELLDWHWKRPVATSAALPDGDEGDVRVTLNDGRLYGHLNDVWQALGIQGPAGPAGASGAPGAEGPAGPAGEPGAGSIDVSDDLTLVAGTTAVHFEGATVAASGASAIVTVASGGGGGTGLLDVTEGFTGGLPASWTGGTPGDFEVVGGRLRLTSAGIGLGTERSIWRPDLKVANFQLDAKLILNQAVFAFFLGISAADLIYPYVNYAFNGANGQLYQKQNNAGAAITAMTGTDFPAAGAGIERWWRVRMLGDRITVATYASDPDGGGVNPPITHVGATVPMSRRDSPGTPRSIGVVMQGSAGRTVEVDWLRIRELR